MNLNQITIPSLDVEKATEFYKILGLNIIVDALPKYVRFECKKGDTTLSIHKVDKLAKGTGAVLYFEVKNLDEEVLKLKKKGIKFLTEPEDKPWLWREAELKDLDGNPIIIYYAGENRKNPPWRIQ